MRRGSLDRYVTAASGERKRRGPGPPEEPARSPCGAPAWVARPHTSVASLFAAPAAGMSNWSSLGLTQRPPSRRESAAMSRQRLWLVRQPVVDGYGPTAATTSAHKRRSVGCGSKAGRLLHQMTAYSQGPPVIAVTALDEP